MKLEKFKDVQSEILEVAAHTWILALANVNTDPGNFLNRPASEVLRGYAFPDPFLFISAFNNHKDHFAKLLYVWLSIRAPWIARFTSQESGLKPLALEGLFDKGWPICWCFFWIGWKSAFQIRYKCVAVEEEDACGEV